ncbi:MAG: BlaI/MecI/CopY family transcriptional regulator [Bryobacteraceae bacterium]
MIFKRRTLQQNPLPSDGELDILAALWRIGPATVRQVHEALDKGNGYTTTLKQMQLMTEKGLLTRSERFGAHVYEPGVPKEQTQAQVARNVMNRVFGGSAESLVLGALSSRRTSEEEIGKIRRMLDEFEKKKRGSR